MLQHTHEATAQYPSTLALADEWLSCGESIDVFDRPGCTGDQDSRTGDWWGVRSSLRQQGITFDGAVTQFCQGVASGGLDQRFEYSGHGDYELSFDFGKLIDVEGLTLDLGSEHRFGESVNEHTGIDEGIVHARDVRTVQSLFRQGGYA
jgi:hypothetical protein